MTNVISTTDNDTHYKPNNLSQESSNTICDGFGCNEKFTMKIEVNAGKFGKITLQLCDSCIKKFDSKTSGVSDNEKM